MDSKINKDKKVIIAFFLIGLLCVGMQTAQAQNYTVMKVVGQVFQSGKLVNQWDELEPNTQLTFANEHSALRVLQGNRVFVVSATKAKPSHSNELVATLKDAFLPEKPPVKRASTRGVITTANDIALELGQSMNGSVQTILIIGQKEYSFSKSVFAVSDKNFFFVSYKYNNEDINKKLPNSSSNGFVLSQAIFTVNISNTKSITVDPATIKGNFILYYYIDSNTKEQVAIFNAVFVNENDLVRELSPLVKQLKADHLSTQEINKRVGDYLQQYYGLIDDDQLNKLASKL